MLLWDVADKFKFPKRGFIVKSANSKNNDTTGNSQDTHIGLNYIRQKNSSKNGFIAVSSSGEVVKVEIPPIINEGTHKGMLSNPGSKLVWTPEAISYMSNIGSNTGEVIATKTRAEKYFQENSNGGIQSISQIDVQTIISSKPDISLFYPAPVLQDN